MAFFKWAMADMKARGVAADVTTVNAGLRVFRRACEWADESTALSEEEATRQKDLLVDAAIDMVNACARGGGGYELAAVVEPNDDTFVGLVEVAVFAAGLRRADRLLQQMEQKGANREALARAYTAFVPELVLRG